ncbi:hypothetical protein PRUPE_3G155000 [Prunus persica]|uniref:Uncharacterized protein n=1 Tax=Prunus persica TaxID=3760 RepID=A0A251Q0P6_PRUPE|nr:hypothetical protein PRUPE_3G155000 [Prunus persica]ONI17373.1 hypothetical protein PRUPE_3G155000 [Prunus persica]
MKSPIYSHSRLSIVCKKSMCKCNPSNLLGNWNSFASKFSQWIGTFGCFFFSGEIYTMKLF